MSEDLTNIGFFTLGAALVLVEVVIIMMAIG